MTTATSPADALAGRLFGATLGLSGSLAQRGPQAADELAGSAGIAPRNDHGGDL
jgi:hypothetical protein